MIYAEGHPSDTGLAPASSLPERLVKLVGSIADYGIPVPTRARRYERVGEADSHLTQMAGPGFGGLRRVDVTADLETTPAEGQALMTAALQLLVLKSPHGVRPVFGKAGQLETVALHGTRGILSRLYDKGQESATARRWTMPRLEAQLRFKSDNRLTVDGFDGPAARHYFNRRFQPLWTAGEGVKIVTDVFALRDQLVDAVDRGELTFSKAERILGSQLMTSGQDRSIVNRQTQWRRRKLVAESGYLLTETLEESMSFAIDDLHALLDDAEVWNG